MTMHRSSRFYTMCAGLPLGHRHCVHGHLPDCPDVDDCALLPPERPPAHAVMAGRMCWLFTSRSLTQSLVRVLTDGGVSTWHREGMSEADVSALLAGLRSEIIVEDRR